MKNELKWLAIGRIGKTKGLKGELFFDAYNPSSEALFRAETVRIGEKELRIDEYSTGSKRPIVRFEEIQTIDEAKALVGEELWVNRSELPELKPGQFYVGDLVGFSVRSKEKTLGEFSGLMTTKSNDIYVVNGTEGEVLLPILPGVLEKIDLDQQTIWVNPPEVVHAV